jgi:exodeoxyribonuclease-1
LTLDLKSGHGQPSTKLGNVCRQNGVDLSEDAAHEAVADVKATIDLAKLIRQKDPEFWDHLVSMSTQENVQEFIDDNEVMCYTRNFFGRANHKFVTSAVADPEREIDLYVCDLQYPPEEYLDKSPSELKELLGTKNKPFLKVKTNSVPTLIDGKEVQVDLYPEDIDFDEMERRARVIAAHDTFHDNLRTAIELLENDYPPSRFIEKQKYQDIPEEAENLLELWSNEFHAGDWEERAELIEIFPHLFKSFLEDTPTLMRFSEFAKRILFETKPELLDDDDRQRVLDDIRMRVTGEDAHDRMITIPDARLEVLSLRKELAEDRSKLLEPGDEHKLDALDALYDKLEEDLINRYLIDPPSPPSTAPTYRP